MDGLETIDGRTFTGEVEIDRRMNVLINRVLIRGTEIRYMILSDEETEIVLERMRPSEEEEKKVEKEVGKIDQRKSN